MDSPAPPALPDEIADQFNNVRHIGTGARSQVYLGSDPQSSLPLVIKALDASKTPTRAIRSHLDNINRLVSTTSHPNIVTLYAAIDHGRDTVMHLEQYCPGSCSLLVDPSSPLNPDQVIAIGIRMCEALTHIHASGLLHLDLTADHIRFADEATPCLADLGVAQLHPPRWRLSDGKIAPGAWHTPPEFVTEDPPTVTSDVYGLASVLYELLAGRPAIETFPGDSPAALCVRILQQPIQPVIAAGVPRELSDLLLQCLDRRPDNRPSTTDQLRQGLWAASESLGSTWTGRLAIPEPTGVLNSHDTVVIWRSSN